MILKHFDLTILNNYSPKAKWLLVNIHGDEVEVNIYGDEVEVNIYHNHWAWGE